MEHHEPLLVVLGAGEQLGAHASERSDRALIEIDPDDLVLGCQCDPAIAIAAELRLHVEQPSVWQRRMHVMRERQGARFDGDARRAAITARALGGGSLATRRADLADIRHGTFAPADREADPLVLLGVARESHEVVRRFIEEVDTHSESLGRVVRAIAHGV